MEICCESVSDRGGNEDFWPQGRKHPLSLPGGAKLAKTRAMQSQWNDETAKATIQTHAAAVLSLVDQPDGEALAREVYDGRMGIVPYIAPGFGLAVGLIDERQH